MRSEILPAKKPQGAGRFFACNTSPLLSCFVGSRLVFFISCNFRYAPRTQSPSKRTKSALIPKMGCPKDAKKKPCRYARPFFFAFTLNLLVLRQVQELRKLHTHTLYGVGFRLGDKVRKSKYNTYHCLQHLGQQ